MWLWAERGFTRAARANADMPVMADHGATTKPDESKTAGTWVRVRDDELAAVQRMNMRDPDRAGSVGRPSPPAVAAVRGHVRVDWRAVRRRLRRRPRNPPVNNRAVRFRGRPGARRSHLQGRRAHARRLRRRKPSGQRRPARCRRVISGTPIWRPARRPSAATYEVCTNDMAQAIDVV